MTECITTTKDYIIDEIPAFEQECPVCLKITKQRVTWVSIYCLSCHGEHGLDYTMGMIASQRRRIALKISRKELGKLFNLKTNTIGRYERGSCPKVYFEKLGQLIKQKG